MGNDEKFAPSVLTAGRAKKAVPTKEKMTVIHFATGFCGEKSPYPMVDNVI